MKRTVQTLMITLVAVAIAGLTVPGQAADDHDHTIVTSPEVQWAPGPPVLPAGAQAAVLYGNPGEEGLFALRLKLPAGYIIPPHTHPKPEIVTVISGTFHIGMGRALDRTAAQALPAGGFFAFPPGMAHFAFTEEETVVQLNSTGPWSLEYINPEDDPRR